MKKFNETIKILPQEIQRVLEKIDDQYKPIIQEIRLRIDKPLVLIKNATACFVSENSELQTEVSENSLIINSDVFQRTYRKICDYSIHSNMNSLVNGFITTKDGNRVGICSTAVYKENEVYSVKNVSSMNIRIAREFKGCSVPILNLVCKNQPSSFILAGKPSSGKTTMLRDMVYQLSSGFEGLYKRVVVIDQRSEIASVTNDFGQNDVGINADVLNGFKKSDGIEIAVRTLSPDFVVCDEIGNQEEVNSIKYGFSSGVNFIVSVHLSDKSDLLANLQIKELLNTNQFKYVVILKDDFKSFELYSAKEVLNEIHRTSADSDFSIANRH